MLDNLNNEQFGVNELSKEVGFSRSHLHRKLYAVEGKSISQFIRAIRLQVALKLLRSDGLTASEVAYKVGFNNPSYFNTCFHEFFGYPPGEAKHHSTEIPDKLIADEKPGEAIATIKTKPAGDKPSNAKKKLMAVKFLIVFVFVAIGLLIILFLGSNKHIDSLIVIPPNNYTGQSELDYFVSGMHSSLIGEMGQLSSLRVISEITSKSYKNSTNSLNEIAKEVDVKWAIEPSVFCLGDSICVQLKLIRVQPEEDIVWVDDYKVEKSRLFDFYNQITKQMARKVNLKLSRQDEKRLAKSTIVDTEALDAYMKGLDLLDQINKNSLDSAKKYFRIANQKEPGWALPIAGLAQVWGYQMQMGFVSPSNAIPQIYIYLNKALEIDPYSSNSHYVKAIIAVWTEWDWEKGEKEFKKALELNPSHALSRIFYAHLLMSLHRDEEALKQSNYSLELDPLRPFVLALHAKVLMNNGDFENAKEYIEKAVSLDPDHHMVTNALLQFCKVTGDYERWFEVWKKRSAWRGDESLASIEKIFKEKGYLATTEEIIRINEEKEKAGGRISYHGHAMCYLQTKNYKKAIEYLYKSYDEHNPNLPYASTRRYDSHILKEYPEYVALMEKMGLPVEK